MSMLEDYRRCCRAGSPPRSSDLVLDLDDHMGAGLLILSSGGVWYRQQAGGTQCAWPHGKGVFLPLGNDLSRSGALIGLGADLMELSEEWTPWPFLSERRAAPLVDRLRELLAASPFDLWLCDEWLDRSMEGWLLVELRSAEGLPLRGDLALPRLSVLLWPNSD